MSDAGIETDGPDPPIDVPGLVAAHGEAAFRLATAIVRDRALAEDVVQETFIKVWTRIDSFAGEGSLRSWILAITHNTAVSTLRRIRDVATDPDLLPEQVHPVSTERRATGRIALEQLEIALGELDVESRAIVVMREIEGLAYDDIAEALGVPLSFVKTRLFRARRRLTTALGDWA